jgi:hypothetical protein
MNHRLDVAKEQLIAASRLGLSSHRAEIEALVTGIDQQERIITNLRQRGQSLQDALGMQDSIIDDLNSRINALEAAIRDYLDPDRARDGASVLLTVLDKELGEEEELLYQDS